MNRIVSGNKGMRLSADLRRETALVPKSETGHLLAAAALAVAESILGGLHTSIPWRR